MPRSAGCVVLGLLVWCGPLQGQATWGITPEVGWDFFSGGSEAESGPSTFRISQTTGASLRIDRTGPGIGIGLSLLYLRAGVEENSATISVTAHDVVKLVSVRPEISFPVLRPGAGVVRVHAGASLGRWSLQGVEARYVTGGVAGVGLLLPFSPTNSLSLRWEGEITGSTFTSEDLPDGFDPRRTFHSRVGIGVRFGF